MRRFANSPVVRWAATLAWIGLILVLMLTPSDRAVVDNTSDAFGGTDLTDAIGHGILYGVLAILWWAALACYGEVHKTFWLAMALVAVLGVTLEIAQYWVPERGPSLLDFVANLVGIAGVMIGYQVWPHLLTALISPK